MKKITILIIILIISIKNTNAQIDTIRVYAFGHSLVDHRPPLISTPSDETTIMHWMYDIAQVAGHNFAGGGQYGFLTNHDDLPPNSQWGYDVVPGVWDEDLTSFSDANINTILITAANFIQYQPSDMPHPLDAGTSVVQSTTTVFDWVNQQESGVKYYIYGNWPEMDLQNAYPPTPPTQMEVDDFHNQTTGQFTDWWLTYQDNMLINRPALNTRLIPVGTIISKILRDLIPGQVPFTELYEDSAPHGRASLYFLAGMITYMAIFEENIPTTYLPDAIVHQGIRNNLQLISDFAWNELNNFNLPDGTSRVFCPTTSTDNSDLTLTNNTIQLMPNPTNGFFSIAGTLPDYSIEILDANGNIYQIIDNASSTVTIDLNTIPDGLYFVRIINQSNGVLTMQKIIKMN